MPEGDERGGAPLPMLDLVESGGTDLSRILSLSDGIFGFAMTLMVLTLVIPSLPNPAPGSKSGWLAEQLYQEIPSFEWYALGFILIAVWWVAHHSLFEKIRRWDRLLVGINLAFLLTIAAAPFFIELLQHYSMTQTAVAAYAGSQVVTSLCFTGLWFYATGQPGIMDIRVDRTSRMFYRRQVLLRTAVFLVALGVAVVSPEFALYVLLGTLLVQMYRRRSLAASMRPPSGGGVAGGALTERSTGPPTGASR